MKYIKFVLCLVLTVTLSALEIKADLLSKKEDPVVFIGNKQFLEDFNKLLEQAVTNGVTRGIIQLPENHKYKQLSLPFENPYFNGSNSTEATIKNVAISYDVNASYFEVHNFELDNENQVISSDVASLYCQPSEDANNIDDNAGRGVKLSYTLVSINSTDWVDWPEGRNMLTLNESVYFRVIFSPTRIPRTSRCHHRVWINDIEFTHKIGAKHLSGYEHVFWSLPINHPDPSSIKLGPGLYKINFSMYFVKKQFLGSCRTTVSRNVMGWLYISGESIPSSPQSLSVQNYCGYSTLSVPSIGAPVGTFWQNLTTGESYHVKGNDLTVRSSGTWKVQTWNTCTGNYSNESLTKNVIIQTRPARPSIRTMTKGPLCEGATQKLSVHNAIYPDHQYKWYKVIYNPLGMSSRVYIGTGASISVSNSGNYQVKIVRDAYDCESEYSSVMKIEFHPNIVGDFSISTPVVPVNDFISGSISGQFTATDKGTIDWGDGTKQSFAKKYVGGFLVFYPSAIHRYKVPGIYEIRMSVENEFGCSVEETFEVTVYRILCEGQMAFLGGEFVIDNLTGRLIYKRGDCPGEESYSCFSVTPSPDVVGKAISATAVTYSDQWDYSIRASGDIQNIAEANLFEKALAGNWRALNSYVYKTNALDNSYNYQAGTFDHVNFNWDRENTNSNAWVRTDSVSLYTKDGIPAETYNVLNVPSVAKFAYKGAVPYLFAQNSTYEAVHFESFESDYNSTTGCFFENGIIFSSTEITVEEGISHSGKKSIKLIPAGEIKQLTLSGLKASSKMISDGAVLRFWANFFPIFSINESFPSFTAKINKSGYTYDLAGSKAIAQVGEWTLFEVDIATNWSSIVSPNEPIELVIQWDNKVDNINYDIYIDDIRFRTKNATMSTYVYDPETLKLLATFDDQHFGVYYQYNEEGKLVRKLIETVEGLKTIQEVQYNTPSEPGFW